MFFVANILLRKRRITVAKYLPQQYLVCCRTFLQRQLGCCNIPFCSDTKFVKKKPLQQRSRCQKESFVTTLSLQKCALLQQHLVRQNLLDFLQRNCCWNSSFFTTIMSLQNKWFRQRPMLSLQNPFAAKFLAATLQRLFGHCK